MKLSDIRRETMIPQFSADCDDCKWKFESMGERAVERVLEQAKAHALETDHTTEVWIHQSIRVFRCKNGVEKRDMRLDW